MTTPRPCKTCHGLGSRPPCRTCGKMPELTAEEEAAAVAAFRALPHAVPVVTHTISDAGGRITIRRVTPADVGILAVTLDDARADGLGDDDTMDRLTAAARVQGIDESLVYPWFRAAC